MTLLDETQLQAELDRIEGKTDATSATVSTHAGWITDNSLAIKANTDLIGEHHPADGTEPPIVPGPIPPIPPVVDPDPIEGTVLGGNDGWWHKTWDPSNPYDADGILIPAHLDYRRPFRGGTRFMDTLNVNNSTRNGVTDAYLETLRRCCKLCNSLRSPMWFCNTWNFSEAATYRALELIEETLDQDLEVTPEPANEIWNSQFYPYKWIKATHGVELGHDLFFNEWAIRANRLFKVSEDVFQNRAHVNTLGGQTANPWVLRQVMKRMVQPVHAHAQTSYFKAGQWYSGISDDEMLTRNEQIIGSEIDLQLEHLAQTLDFNLIPSIYEANHHWSITYNVEAMAQFDRIQDTPRGIAMVKLTLDEWFANGGSSRVMAYRFFGKNNKYSAWGISPSPTQLTNRYAMWASYARAAA